ncbi:Gypsy/Ty-3 retroelement polyprotein, related [Eimeria mitis]|uniref:Gypsy/Ty-3 retroelement polyprotein, related n=1 Tax=Eimeria mitis TaxID=44415 RepID=U6K9N0_9EIME|nr:Gypsy/Ty-3 retroelement polyprotein, related [Eimeria mitis]CDJ34745.1 Gypsy/Ty-3 retroelement polyprotein, related [Eimeria mitis]
MRSSDVAMEAIPPGSDERVHLSALPTAFAFSMVQGVETVSEEKGSDKAPSLCGGTEENNGDTHALRRDALVKTAVLGESVQLTPAERHKWAKLKEELLDVLNNKELQAGMPPAGRSMHPIELIPGSAPRFIPRYRRTPHLDEEIGRQADELLKKGTVQPSTSAFGHNPVLAKEKDGRWCMCGDFKPLNTITVKQKFPIPRVEEILDRIQGSAVYAAFDFAEAFLQIPIEPGGQAQNGVPHPHSQAGVHLYALWPCECTCRTAAASQSRLPAANRRGMGGDIHG